MSANGDDFYRNFRRNEDKNFFGFEVPDSGKAKEGRKKSIRGEERIQREKGRRKEGGNDGDTDGRSSIQFLNHDLTG